METQYEARDPDFENRVRHSFAAQQAMATFGISIAGIGPGWIVLGFERTEALTQQHGFVHAGVVATAMDSACGYAAFSLMPADAEVLTVEYKINLLRPARDDAYRVEARVIKPGRTLTVCDAITLPEGGSSPVASMTATVMAIAGRTPTR